MSPVNDAYKKRLCHLASKSSEFVMVDPWEARQSTFQRSLTVLSRVKSILCESGQVPRESLKVMLVCGSDLLQSFGIPGAWIPDQVRTICRDYGVVCIRKEGQDVEKIISDDEILNEFRDNIKVVDELIPNQISSTRVREKVYVVLVANGSFNPPTYMHLRMFELARDALNAEGYCVIGGYMSPVNYAYKKRGLLSAEHRLQLCHLASKSSEFVMVDPWEVNYSLSQVLFFFFWQLRADACLNSTLFHFDINVFSSSSVKFYCGLISSCFA
ncbi:nicotinamide/nicotinic acid mononucleotide adenylyltransferase-like isoform X12 [Quercus robur]|uniref:nicotinamide/nicotinic acid mononucleotide adenylyltransferase-like isoform X12 n=1 Tax=Quercus robur TaxID=38942 RepID=UPI002161D001|nr:nicotinamide/nicotinic acid mononucleotide adenylyltransferase-like isoform X12 [Quercus robur]